MSSSRLEPAWGSRLGHLDLPPAIEPGDSLTTDDRTLIVDLLHRYGWAYDERRLDVMRTVFTDDMTFLGSVAGTVDVGPYRGWERFAAWLGENMDAQRDQRRHLVLNDTVTGTGAGTARSLSNLLLTSTIDGSTSVVTTGFYRCDLRREPGPGWRVSTMFAGFDNAF